MSEKEQLIKEINYLKHKLRDKEQKLRKLEQLESLHVKSRNCNNYCGYFNTSEISRYSRQIIIPTLGIEGQEKLKNSNILIVGVGGLGCPSSQYLVAAGVGKIDILDYDEVDLTNLHRQILHGENNVNQRKVLSGYESLKRLNSNVEINPLDMHADSSSLEKLLSEKKYNVVVDCTDNVATRYLLNDICVINKIPLVSGSALQLEGQLTVYNYKNGPCYRCLFPIPPPPEIVTSCGDGGVLGVIPGVIGVLQALEVIKILVEYPGVLSGRLLLFDGSDTTFRNIKLRQRNAQCVVCGDNPTVIKPIDYEQFCGAKATDKVVNIKILDPSDEISVKEIDWNSKIFILDVRPKIEFKMCRLPNSTNFPFVDILKGRKLYTLKNILEVYKNDDVYVLCRRGNDSQRSICILKEKTIDFNINCKFLNVKGGLHAYSKFVDSNFPIY